MIVYTGEHFVLNLLSRIYIRLMSWLSFAY